MFFLVLFFKEFSPYKKQSQNKREWTRCHSKRIYIIMNFSSRYLFPQDGQNLDLQVDMKM